MRTHPLPPPDSDCIMQDVKLHLLNLQWFRVLGSSFLRFGVFVFEIWGLRFRDRGLHFLDLGSSFSSASFSKLPAYPGQLTGALLRTFGEFDPK